MLNAIKANIQECDSSHLSLVVGNRRLFSNWNIQDFTNVHDNYDGNQCPSRDHTYTTRNRTQVKIDQDTSAHQSDIFDSEGNWKSKHI